MKKYIAEMEKERKSAKARIDQEETPIGKQN